MTITNFLPQDHHLLCVTDDIKCDPMWEEIFKKLFIWANTQGLMGIKVYDLTIMPSPGNDPLCQRQWVKCTIKEER